MTQRGFPLADEDVSESEWSIMARWWLPNGVVEAQDDELEVFGDSTGRQVKVRVGKAFVQGHYYDNDAVVTLALSANSSGNPRRDLVTLRLDTSGSPSTFALHVIEGTPAGSPSTPSPVQTSTVYDFPLGYATVANGAVTIAAGDVVDQRAFAVPINAPKVHGLISTTTSAAASRGIDSVTDLSTGMTQVNFRTAFSAAAGYMVNATAQSDSALFANVHDSSKAAGSCQIHVRACTTGTLTDPNWFSITCWGS